MGKSTNNGSKDDANAAQENGGKKTYQETVVLSKKEMGIRSENDREADSPEKGGDDYQATVALSREELGMRSGPPPETGPPEDGKDDYQATVALSREDLGIGKTERKTIPEEGFQETVFLSRDEMGLPTDRAESSQEDNYQATVALPREDFDYENDPTLGVPGGPVETGYQETVAISREDMDVDRSRPEGGEMDYGATVALSKTEMGVPSAVDPDDFRATETEKSFFRRLVAKNHGPDKYRNLGKLVAGGMGAILRVLDQDLQRTSAMKVVLPAFKHKEDALTGFIAEAKITGLLEHPNVIPVHDLGLTEDEGLYFTMKLAQGEALNDILDRLMEGDPATAETYTTYPLLNIFRKVCDAISYAHSKNIIHQDIKPHNIMVGQYGEVLLMDWGLARYIGDPDQEADPVQRELINDFLGILKSDDDIIKGSPVYMAPEQVIGEGAGLDRSTDIFLLGSTLYHMFTLAPPYFGDSIQEIFEKARNVELTPPDRRSPDRQIPEEVCRIILKAMAPDKANRYATVEEMAEDIDDLIAGKWSRQEKKRFAAGEMLMTEGEAGDEAYLILSGKVQVVKGRGDAAIVLSTLGPGDIVGEMSLIAQVTRSAGVKALQETEAAVLTQQLLSQNLKKLPPYMEKIVSTLTDRLRIANENIHPYAAADPTEVVLKQLRLLLRYRAGENQAAESAALAEMVKEIAHDLGLPANRVADVLSSAAEAGTLVVRDGVVALRGADLG